MIFPCRLIDDLEIKSDTMIYILYRFTESRPRLGVKEAGHALGYADRPMCILLLQQATGPGNGHDPAAKVKPLEHPTPLVWGVTGLRLQSLEIWRTVLVWA